jgi:hypothetical protein
MVVILSAVRSAEDSRKRQASASAGLAGVFRHALGELLGLGLRQPRRPGASPGDDVLDDVTAEMPDVVRDQHQIIDAGVIVGQEAPITVLEKPLEFAESDQRDQPGSVRLLVVALAALLRLPGVAPLDLGALGFGVSFAVEVGGHVVPSYIEGKRCLLSAACCGIEDVLSYFDGPLRVAAPPVGSRWRFSLRSRSRRGLVHGSATLKMDLLGEVARREARSVETEAKLAVIVGMDVGQWHERGLWISQDIP